jgi:hypothetical protein
LCLFTKQASQKYFYFSSSFLVVFLAETFLVSATSVSILSSSHSSFLEGFLAAFLGAFCKAFKDKPILFLLGSKLIILAVTSSPTLIYSLISLTTP